MFALCEGMKWNHLPHTGLLKDQNPVLLDKWRIIFSERATEEERKSKERERNAKRGRSSGNIIGPRGMDSRGYRKR